MQAYFWLVSAVFFFIASTARFLQDSKVLGLSFMTLGLASIALSYASNKKEIYNSKTANLKTSVF